MQWSLRRLSLFTALAVAILTGAPVSAHAARHALVIGIDRYAEIEPLHKAAGDARAMAAMLEGLGYQVTAVIDADRRTINTAVSDLISRISAGDTVVVHYSGHGVEIGGENYLLPSDVPKPTANGQDLVVNEAINLASLMERVSASGAGARIFIIDACRDNPFAKAGTRGIGGSRGLSRVEAPEGTFVLYSAGYGQMALDRLGEADAEPTSVYTRVLLTEIASGRPITEIAVNVRRRVEVVAKEVGHQQRPAYYDELTNSSEFVFGEAGTAVDGAGSEAVEAGESSAEPADVASVGVQPSAVNGQADTEAEPLEQPGDAAPDGGELTEDERRSLADLVLNMKLGTANDLEQWLKVTPTFFEQYRGREAEALSFIEDQMGIVWGYKRGNSADGAASSPTIKKAPSKTDYAGIPTTYEEGIDRPGNDYDTVPLKEANPKLCFELCVKDGRCLAWTYVRPGSGKERAQCWLKDAVPKATKSSCCTSGIKAVDGGAG